MGVWGFLKRSRKYWLPPLILLAALFAAVVYFKGGSISEPFVYKRF